MFLGLFNFLLGAFVAKTFQKIQFFAARQTFYPRFQPQGLRFIGASFAGEQFCGTAAAGVARATGKFAVVLGQTPLEIGCNAAI